MKPSMSYSPTGAWYGSSISTNLRPRSRGHAHDPNHADTQPSAGDAGRSAHRHGDTVIPELAGSGHGAAHARRIPATARRRTGHGESTAGTDGDTHHALQPVGPRGIHIRVADRRILDDPGRLGPGAVERASRGGEVRQLPGRRHVAARLVPSGAACHAGVLRRQLGLDDGDRGPALSKYTATALREL